MEKLKESRKVIASFGTIEIARSVPFRAFVFPCVLRSEIDFGELVVGGNPLTRGVFGKRG